MAVIVSVILVAMILAFVAALGWKIFQLIKAPRDASLRAVTLCLISAACSFVLARQPFSGWIASLAGPSAPRLVQNLCVLSMVFWLMCFYLYSAAPDADEGNRRARREALLLTLAAIGLITATAAAGVGDHGADFQGSDLRDPALVSFYLIADVYLVYALSMALRWTCSYARASQRPLATGLWMAAVGIGAMAGSCTIRTVLTVVRWQGGTVPRTVTWASSVIIALAVPLFLLGVSYPGAATRLAAVRVRRQHRRMYHRLGPLWQMLHEAYPEHSLYRMPATPWRDRLLPLGLHRRYYRRVIECRDGLVRISPYLAPTAGLGEDQPGWADAMADRLYAALHSDHPHTPVQAVAVAMPLTQSLEDDVRQLVQLSDAVRRRVLAGAKHTDAESETS
ncbi:MAB_1171c family putative transporter [Streptomyces sp. NPDC001604]|uniref:MAB_1171c family putative transporter n=1 Tax=Streptomyces sp. NPDC001604 TaxID=3364593 RepID=UPI0036857FDC